jgi:hypothetical protein
MQIKMTKVDSSVIAEVGYKDGFLHLRFVNGKLYQYENIPADIYEMLTTKTTSIGRFYNNVIRGKRPATLIHEEDIPELGIKDVVG